MRMNREINTTALLGPGGIVFMGIYLILLLS